MVLTTPGRLYLFIIDILTCCESLKNWHLKKQGQPDALKHGCRGG